jgi:hypothetical protein
MKIRKVYETRDDKIFRNFQDARSHVLSESRILERSLVSSLHKVLKTSKEGTQLTEFAIWLHENAEHIALMREWDTDIELLEDKNENEF